MISNECFFSDCCDQVSCSGKETWTQLSELENKTNNIKAFFHAENLLEVMLLEADMYFQHKFDVENAFVCDAHHKILLQSSYLRNSTSKCDTCSSVRGTSLHVKAALRHITVSQAITLFEVFKLKNSYGKLICPECRMKVSKSAEPTRGKLHGDAFECLFNPESVCCVGNDMDDQDPDYQPPFDPSIDEQRLKEQITALNNFLAACGSKRKVSVTTSYKDLSHRVKLRYVSLTKFIMQSATSLIASNDADRLMHDAFSDVNSGDSNIVLDGNFRQIMSCSFGSVQQCRIVAIETRNSLNCSTENIVKSPAFIYTRHN